MEIGISAGAMWALLCGPPPALRYTNFKRQEHPPAFGPYRQDGGWYVSPDWDYLVGKVRLAPVKFVDGRAIAEIPGTFFSRLPETPVENLVLHPDCYPVPDGENVLVYLERGSETDSRSWVIDIVTPVRPTTPLHRLPKGCTWYCDAWKGFIPEIDSE